MRCVFLGLALTISAGCDRHEAPPTAAEANAPSPKGGGVRLDATRQSAAGLKFREVEKRKVADSLSLTGWLIPVPGSEVVIKATTAGYVTPPPADGGGSLPAIGDEAGAGKVLASLQVFVSPQEQAQLVGAKEDADAAIGQADVTIRLIGEQLQRAKTAQDSINLSRIVELQEAYDKARAAQREAKEKLPYLPVEPYGAQPALRPVEITSPLTGRITDVHAAARQFVAAGDPLWTVADWSQLWVRVPVFEADQIRVLATEGAQLTSPGFTKEPLTATRVTAPQRADPTRRTADLCYRLNNVGGALRPGQAVAVALPITASAGP